MSVLPSYITQSNPWEKRTHPIWLSSLVSLKRNIASFCFPAKLNTLELEHSLQLINQAFSTQKDFFSLPAEKLKALDKELLFEYFLCEESFQNCFNGQGFVLNKTGQFFAQLNIQDHINMQWIDSIGDLENSYTQLASIETDLGASLPFAYNTTFGYLTTNPAVCGTGLRISAYLHIPALVFLKKLPHLKEQDPAITLQFLVENIAILRNRYTLGVSEEDILRSLCTNINSWIALEEKARAQLSDNQLLEAKDAVSRAYGLLMHANLIQTKEALNSLSLLKWGSDMGWVEGFNNALFNQLFFNCQRAHTSHLFSIPEKNLDDLCAARATHIKKTLTPTHLLI